MAKKLLLRALVDALGDYIEGLTEDNLKVGVWSGNIELKNLVLNRNIVNKFPLPSVSIHHGTVSKLTVSIPWTSLDKNPVKVRVDGVYLLISPLSTSNCSRIELIDQVKAQTKMKLEEAERSIQSNYERRIKDDSSKSESSSYFSRLVTKIVDNIEVTVCNLHLRFEDTLSAPGNMLSFGITLESFTISSTDENWNESFLRRDAKSTTYSIHKLTSLTNITAYWDLNGPNLHQIPPGAELEAAMNNLVYKNEHQNPPINNYIMGVPNAMVVKFVHNHGFSNDLPRVDVMVDCSSVRLAINYDYYEQFLRIQKTLSEIDESRRRKILRPSGSVSEAPRAWWRYAFLCVTCKEEIMMTNKVKLILITLNVCICKNHDKHTAQV